MRLNILQFYLKLAVFLLGVILIHMMTQTVSTMHIRLFQEFLDKLNFMITLNGVQSKYIWKVKRYATWYYCAKGPVKACLLKSLFKYHRIQNWTVHVVEIEFQATQLMYNIPDSLCSEIMLPLLLFPFMLEILQWKIDYFVCHNTINSYSYEAWYIILPLLSLIMKKNNFRRLEIELYIFPIALTYWLSHWEVEGYHHFRHCFDNRFINFSSWFQPG